MHGQFVWYELTTPDVDAARKFYPVFTGWGTQPFDNDYTMWTAGGVPVGGLFRLSDEMRGQGVPPNWMPYVEADNVDETAGRAESLGGRVVVPAQEVPGAGRFAVLQDPQGATFGIYRSATQSGAWDGTPVIGRMSWHELMTTDYRKASEFYRGLFGWEQVGDEMDMGGGEMYHLFGKGSAMYGGMYNRMPEMAGMPPFWLCYIHVKDVGKAVAAATRAGATVIRPQMDIPGGSIAILADPQGAGFAVHHMSAAAPAPDTAKPAATPARKARPKKAAKKAAAKSKSKPKTTSARKSVAKKAPRKAAKKTAKRAAKATRRAGTKAKAVKATRRAETKSKPGAAKKARSRARPSAGKAARRVVRRSPAMKSRSRSKKKSRRR